MSVRAPHEAVLADGRRVLLLGDRAGPGSCASPGAGAFRGRAPARGARVIWATETVEEMKRTARMVVGPDEPFEGHSQADMEAGHWDTLSRILRQHGIEVAAAELKALPHDVELSDRVLAHGHGRRDAR